MKHRTPSRSTRSTKPGVQLLRFPLAAMLALATVVALGAPSSVQAKAKAPHVVEIDGERIAFGQLDPTVPRELLNLDIAPSPRPGHSTYISREAIRTALIRAGADPGLADAFPSRQKVTRSSKLLSKTELEKELRPLVQAKLPLGVTISGVLGLKDVTLPTGEHELGIRLSKLRRSTRATLNVQVGERTWARLNVNLILDGQARTPVLKRDLPRQAVIGQDDVVMASTPLERLPQNTALRQKDLVGKRLVAPQKAGAPVQTRTVKVPPMIERGRQVTLIARGGGISISQPVKVEEDGKEGEWVRVRPVSGTRPMRAKVVSPSVVTIELGVTP